MMRKIILISIILLLSICITPPFVSADTNDSWEVALYFTSLSSSSDNTSPPSAPATYERIFGISSNATDGFDRDIDKPAPPEPQGDALDVYFPCQHDVVTRLATDIKSNDTDEWKLNIVVPSQSTTHLRWDNASLPEDEDFTIVADGSKTDMNSNDMIEFSSGAHEITIHMGDIPTSPAPSNPSGGNSGGGGGGATGEAFENIASKHAQVNKVAAGENVRYEFAEDDNAVMAIQFKSLTNEGQTKTSIEILKDTSALVDSPAPGKVYQNMNIWVGNVAFDEDDMDDPVVGFRVSKEWISDNDVEPSSVVLCRYHDGEWTSLTTEAIDENENYFIYESETPGFSPFAISAVGDIESSQDKISGTEESIDEVTEDENISDSNTTDSNELPGFGTVLSTFALLMVMFLRRKD
jgi:PGF-pre-PGF domain-containing protein